MKLYFVRHGETLWNTKKMFQGIKNSNLTDFGKEQTRKLKDSLKNTEFAYFYTSPLGRAIETMDILVEDRDGAFINFIPEFKEINMGQLEGMPSEDAKLMYPNELKDLWYDGKSYNPESFGGESFKNVYRRAKMGLKDLIYKHGDSDDNILIVSHGLALDAIFENIRGNTIDMLKERHVPANTSLTIAEYKNNQWNILLFSDTSHLD